MAIGTTGASRKKIKNKFKSTKNCVTLLAIRKHKGHVVFGLFAMHVTAHCFPPKRKHVERKLGGG